MYKNELLTIKNYKIMTKKITLTILIITALLVAIYKWIMRSDETKKQPVEETKAANKETENVKGQTEEVTANDKVNENQN